jgi:hypothetical protein
MSRVVRATTIVLLCMALSFVLAACGPKNTPAPATPPATTGPTGVIGSSELVDTVCTKCHTRDRIDKANKDLVGWQTTINRMITTNKAQVTPEQQSAIAIYLSNR